MDRAVDQARLAEGEKEDPKIRNASAHSRQKVQRSRRLDEYAYPVLTLPNEIVTEIFVHYLPPYPDHPPFTGLGSPTYLLGICRLWRAIALQSPALWRSIKLDASGTDEIPERHVERAQAWLQRSCSSLLSLHFEISVSSVSKSHESLLQTVMANRSRWEYIYLRGPPIPLSLISGPFPRLVRMTLATRRDNAGPLVSLQSDNAPRLRFLCLWNIDHGVRSLPWHQLTSLALMNTRFVDSAPILQAATNLLRCKLFTQGGGSVEGLDSIHIHLPRLELLSFDSLNAPDLDENRLGVFTLPSLRRLEVSDRLLGPNRHAIERLNSLVARSGCRLEHVRVISMGGGAPAHDRDWQSLVEACRVAFPLVDVDDRERDFSAGDEWERA
ncbi:hypothetical protein C8F01DRAFT_3915 [Mycena amicta]|nr:hypothetical protein C8F01DRAFT_3915 [Mycena amicta]